MSKVPLYIVTGASGSGKSTVVKELRRVMPDYDVFDYDALIKVMRDDEDDEIDKNKLKNIWLRVARGIAESGRSAIICGRIQPQDIKKCKDFDYFRRIYYLVLHCDEKTREKRLRARSTMTDKKLQSNIDLAKKLIRRADQYSPTMPVIDTSKTNAAKVAKRISKWIHGHK
ncbi:AAA family ATPase [Paenibacillus sp. GCM10027628]|uniref:AAA family ATPase n=1 Tax=Paenibacillus sp. GCM10027628 TaxID=3273413 RepID=UPI00362538EA